MSGAFTNRGLRPAQAATKLGIGLSSLWAKAKHEAGFPQPLKLGPRTTVFLEQELDAYLLNKRDSNAKKVA
ncbi:helix-turn-helix transcriptional regulator [Burkholderia cepacia]|uniref:helix-turn-helix transcriptional regulator n=1 Tax=Burkholderia cepacia TaxID=292 RepID=UPI0009BEF673|nr:AlpA family phage regulatory protein [Burkholderia cepacia]